MFYNTFNKDSLKSFFRTLFAIPEKRNIIPKEVIIEDPDYNRNYIVLQEIYNDIKLYNRDNRLVKFPSIKSVFFQKENYALQDINDKLEKFIEEMSNSRDKKIILYLNEFPILSLSAIKTPFNKIWINILSIAVFPIGIIIYLRAILFRIRLNKNLAKIRINSNNIIKLLKKQNIR